MCNPYRGLDLQVENHWSRCFHQVHFPPTVELKGRKDLRRTDSRRLQTLLKVKNTLTYTKREGQRQRHTGDRQRDTEKDSQRDSPQSGKKIQKSKPIFPERAVVLNVSGGLGQESSLLPFILGLSVQTKKWELIGPQLQVNTFRTILEHI